MFVNKNIEDIREALNGPYPAKDSKEVVDLAIQAGTALQKIGTVLEMQGWDWNDYHELPKMLEMTISELAVDKRRTEDTENEISRLRAVCAGLAEANKLAGREINSFLDNKFIGVSHDSHAAKNLSSAARRCLEIDKQYKESQTDITKEG